MGLVAAVLDTEGGGVGRCGVGRGGLVAIEFIAVD
jgi:hypothetical protein